MRYAPFIAIVLVIAVVAVIAAVASGGKDKKSNNVSTKNTAAGTSSQIPITYNEAKAKGNLDKYTWQPNCDPSTG
jgi:archaellin